MGEAGPSIGNASSPDDCEPAAASATSHFSHCVFFYDSEKAFAEEVTRIVGGGLSAGDRVIVIATAAHIAAVREAVACGPFDPDRIRPGDVEFLDARDTLNKFLVDGTPDPDLFLRHVGGLVARAAADGRKVRAMGEMVALLHHEGHTDAALRLEALWSHLGERLPFTLFCAYRVDDFDNDATLEKFGAVCDAHTAVLSSQGVAGPRSGLFDRLLRRRMAREHAAERVRRQSADRARGLLAAIVDSSDDAIISKSLDGIITSWNAGATRIFGYTAQEMIGKHISTLFPPDRLVEEEKIIARIRNGQRVDHFETVRLRKDGTPVDVSLTISPMRDSTGALIGASKIARDITERKRSQQLLKDREAFLRAVIDTTPDCISTVAADGTLLEMNPAGLAMMGADHIDQVRGRSFYDLVAPENRQKFIAFNENICAGEPGFLEFDILAFNGIRRSLESYGVPLTMPDGRPVHLSLTRDATDRKRAERLLRESESQFRQLANAMPQMVWTTREDGFADYYNERWYEFTGLPRNQFGDASWVSVLHPDDVKRTRKTFYESIRTGNDYLIEYRLKDRFRGGFRWFLGKAHPARDEKGRITRWFGTCTDIDATKRTEERLARRNERLSLLNEAAGHLLAAEEPSEMLRGLFRSVRKHLDVDAYLNWIFDESTQTLRLLSCEGIGPAARESFRNIPQEQSICGPVTRDRRPLHAVDIQNSPDPHLAPLKDLGFRAFACNPLMVEHRLIGTLGFASRSRDYFYDDELEFMRTVSHYVSIAFERVRLLKQLREADRRKDEFLATLAHELRNPLAPIQSGLELLRREPENSALRGQMGEIMERQVRQLTRLVDELLEVSRITSGKISLRREPLDLASILQNALDTSRPLVEKARHDVRVSVPPDPIIVDADPVRLAQVFINLLNNAVKYTDSPGTIHVAVRREGGEAVISIRDTGVGIPADKLPRVFDMFAQIDRTLNRAQGGLGIGLALAKRLVELHGGRITAHSEGPARGSEFVVHIPAIELGLPADASAALGTSAPAQRHLRVLVVDDNRDAALSLGLLLQAYQHATRVAFDGMQALEMAEDFSPDIVLMDIGMPHMDGYETAARMRQAPWFKDAKLVALTGWGQEEDRQKARDAGFHYHFTKPIDINKLLELMQQTQAEESSHERDSGK